jgi:hypothetical protein
MTGLCEAVLFWLKFKIKAVTRKFHSSELTFRLTKSRSEMGWAYACMGDMRNATKGWLENLKKRNS